MAESIDKSGFELNIYEKYDVDRNFICNTIFTLAGTNNKKELTKIIHNSDGSKVVGMIEIGNEKSKSAEILDTFDAKIFFILIKLWLNSGMQKNNDTGFLISNIVKELGLQSTGFYFHKIRTSCNKLATIPIRWRRAYISADKEKKSYLLDDVVFTILSIFDNKLMVDVDAKTNVKKYTGLANYFRFNPYIVENILNGITEEFHVDVLKTLQKKISILLYIYLSYELKDKPATSFKTSDFANRIGLAEYKYATRRYEALEPALRELVDKPVPGGFIRNYKSAVSNLDDDIVVTVYKKEDLLVSLSGNEDDNKLLEVIAHFNKSFPNYRDHITLETLRNMANSKSNPVTVDDLHKYINFVRWEIDSQKKAIENIPGYFRRACEMHYKTADYDKAVIKELEKVRNIKQKDKIKEIENAEREKQSKAREHFIGKIYSNLNKQEQENLMELAKKQYIGKHGKLPEHFVRQQLESEIIEILKQRKTE